MIKDLISDLAYDKILVSQALSRSKLIAHKIKNEIFKKWLVKELEGYNDDDPLMPSYRRISSQMFITYSLPMGQQHSKPVFVPNKEDKDMYELVNFIMVTEPISILEKQIEMLTDTGHIKIKPELARMIARNTEYNDWVVGGYRVVNKGQFQNIIELTKQKLLDTLLELNMEFPDLENEYANTESNKKRVENIITTHIYGNNVPVTIAAGYKVEQRDISINITNNDYQELERLGVENSDLEELKLLIQQHGKDKATLKEKVLKWFGQVSASIASKGIAENIPAIFEYVQKLT